jgi:predicted aspartyl protease
VIAGTVLPTREAVVQLELVGTGGLRTSVQALIDRGFTGYLALPLHLVGALGLPYLQTDRVFLAARG